MTIDPEMKELVERLCPRSKDLILSYIEEQESKSRSETTVEEDGGEG